MSAMGRKRTRREGQLRGRRRYSAGRIGEGVSDDLVLVLIDDVTWSAGAQHLYAKPVGLKKALVFTHEPDVLVRGIATS